MQHPEGWRAAAVAAGLVLAAACGGAGTGYGGTDPAGITIDGSSTVFPITEAVGEEFQKTRRDVRVTVGISGSGGGFQKFCRGEIDLANASRPIRGAELDACARAGVTFIELPVAYDGLAVVVNPRNTWVDHLTVDELRRIWQPAAERRVTRWSDVRPGWPEREIRLFGAGVDSGTFDYFTEAVNGREKASRGDYTSSEDDNVIVQGVARDELALGYFGYAYYEENKDRLKLVPIDSGAGPIAPSPRSVTDGTYRPLSRPLFVYASTRSAGRPEVRAFVEFYLTGGRALAREVGYVPLADREQQLVAARFASATTGTMYAAPDASQTPLAQLLSRR